MVNNCWMYPDYWSAQAVAGGCRLTEAAAWAPPLPPTSVTTLRCFGAGARAPSGSGGWLTSHSSHPVSTVSNVTRLTLASSQAAQPPCVWCVVPTQALLSSDHSIIPASCKETHTTAYYTYSHIPSFKHFFIPKLLSSFLYPVKSSIKILLGLV